MESIEVKQVRKEDYDTWDELVRRSPHGAIFHSSNWSTTCAESLGIELRILGCFRRGQLVGGCSFYVSKRGFLKIASATVQMTPFGGIVLEEPHASDFRRNEESLNDILKSLRITLENGHFDYIRLVNSPEFIDLRPFTWNGWQSVVYYTYYLDLSNFENSISKDARWTINKAAKSGVTVEKSEDVVTFYDLLTETYARQDLRPPVSKEFLKNVVDLLHRQNNGEMQIARTKSGDVAAAEIIVYDEKRAYRWSAASHTELRKTGAPSLLLYEVLQDLKTRGIKNINLMAANTPNLARFVAQLNPRLVPYYGVERKSALVRIAEYLFRRKR